MVVSFTIIKVFILFYVGFTHALQSDDEIKLEFIKIVMKCTKTHPLPMSEILDLHKLIVPTDPKTQCLLACAYRDAKVMNEKGEFDVNENYKIAEFTKAGDDKAIENAKKLVDLCAKVNEVKVKDGQKGCERASLIFKCITENAPKFGFKV